MAKNKKEIDRDLMYQKLMPSVTRVTETEANPTPPAPFQDSVIPSSPTPPASVVAASPAPAPIIAKPIEPKKIHNTVLVNIMESIVLEKLDSAIARFNCCQCDKCKKDIIAITLNKLPPKYMVFEENRMPEILAKQESAQVTAALVQSILKVKSEPRH